jgi:hypothetical protein
MIREAPHAAFSAVVTIAGQPTSTVSPMAWCWAPHWRQSPYQNTARRKGLPQFRVALLLLAISVGALKLILHHVAHVLAP